MTGISEYLNDQTKKKQLNQQVGILSSALEHAVPEQMFSTDPNNPVEGVSTVKALSKASQAGQRIYHITQSNKSTALPNIHHDPKTMTEITNALAVGKEVITHTDAISVPGWSGAGYVILDPTTGDAGYKISGGGNGGILIVTMAFLLAVLLPLLASTLPVFLFLAGLSLLNILSFSSAITNALSNSNLTDDQQDDLIVLQAFLALAASIIAGISMGGSLALAEVELINVVAIGAVDIANNMITGIFYLLERLFNSL